MSTVRRFAEVKSMLEPNDGARSFTIYTNTCYESGPTFDSGEKTYLKITDHRHDMNELSKSFISFEFEATYNFSSPITQPEAEVINPEAEQQNQISYTPTVCHFLGWKNASDILKTLQIENLNIDTDYFSRECTRESFCMNCKIPNEVKSKNKFAHTLYDQARKGEFGVCGGYITSVAQSGTLTFTVTLPVRDITPLKSLPDFPTMLGDIVLNFSINKDSMVWCQCDPYEMTVKSLRKKLSDIATGNINAKYQNVGYERRFIQVGREGRCITDYSTDPVTLSSQKLTVQTLVCKKCTCDVYGYNLPVEIKQRVYDIFNETHYIPAQQVDVVTFPEYYRGGSYNANISQQIHNVSDFIVVLPDTPNTYTCYHNPMLNNLQFICNGVGYPHKPFDNTYDSRFYTTMMRAGDQENYYEAENDFRNSIYSRIRYNDKNSLSDNSSFMVIFQAERNVNGNYYDGIETDTQKVSLELKFSSSDLDKFRNSPSKPQVWLIRDTYWTLNNKEGLRYHKYGTPKIQGA